jgi:hypothetical protein
MRTNANNERKPDTQWSPAEIELLEELVEDSPTGPELAELFPRRTLGAVRQKLFHLRSARGLTASRPGKSGDIEPTMLPPGDPGIVDHWLPAWTKRAAQSNQRFLQALAAA